MRATWCALVVAAVALGGCTSRDYPVTSGGAPLRDSTPAPSTAPGAGQVDARVTEVLETMAARAFNSAAPPAKGSTLTGGLFVNWRGTWTGSGDARYVTNLSTSGVADAAAGVPMRHDPLTDLAFLRNLMVWRQTSGSRSTSLDASIRTMTPIVAGEFAHYGFYRGWVYFDLVDLAVCDPTGPWTAAARAMAAGVAEHFVDPATGALLDPEHHGYDVDDASSSAAMLLDAGRRFDQPGWTTVGHGALTYLLEHGADPTTGLFPGEHVVQGGRDVVSDPLVKVGEQAQTLDALLTAYDLTGDDAALAAVQRAVDALWSPTTGLRDVVHGGFFYAVDADGRNVRTAYKETRQAWVLPLLRHLGASGGRVPANGVAEMADVVTHRLHQDDVGGYVYRVAPDFSSYVSTDGDAGSVVVENWVTSEAMGIAAAALLPPVRPTGRSADDSSAARATAPATAVCLPTGVGDAADADDTTDPDVGEDGSVAVLPGGVVVGPEGVATC